MVSSILCLKDSEKVRWDEAPGIHTFAPAVRFLIHASVKLFEHEWNNLRAAQPQLLPHLWQLCAHAVGMPVETLKLITFWGSEWKSMTHDSFKRVSNGLVDDDLVPPVTDPEWQLDVVAEKAVE